MLNIKRKFSITLLLVLIFNISSQAQKINQFNANGKRTGVWKKYYDSNRIRYSGQFKDGKEVGTFKFYENTPASLPVIVKEFSVASDTAFVQFFTPKGKLKSKGNMVGKKREGVWSFYFTNGKILSEETYVNGELNGVVKNYYPSGIVTEETYYVNGKKEGLSKVYTDAGILIEEVNYKAGKLDGLAKYYDLKGQLKEKGNYKEGKKAGKWEFFMDGEVVDKKKRTTLSDLKNK